MPRIGKVIATMGEIVGRVQAATEYVGLDAERGAECEQEGSSTATGRPIEDDGDSPSSEPDRDARARYPRWPVPHIRKDRKRDRKPLSAIPSAVLIPREHPRTPAKPPPPPPASSRLFARIHGNSRTYGKIGANGSSWLCGGVFWLCKRLAKAIPAPQTGLFGR